MKLDSSIKPQLLRFYRWWTGELSFLLPTPIKAFLDRSKEYLLLEVMTGEAVNLKHLTAGAEAELGRFALDEAGSQERERFFAGNARLAEVPIAMRLAPGQALRKRIKLPLAAEENLNQVLSFEMDKMTPFKPGQVYFDAHLAKRIPATRQIEVNLVYTPRSKLNAILDELAGWGWRPQAVFIADDARPGGYNLLPEKYRPAGNRWTRVINATLGGVILALLVALMTLPIWTARSEAMQLEESVKQTGRIAKEVEDLRQQRDNLLHQSRFLQDRKQTEPVMLDMLEEFSRVIPENTWLNGLQYKDRHIVIQGQSPSASSLIEAIDKSVFFNNTNFVSPVTKDTTNGLERFQIASDVVNGRFSEKPH